MFITIKNVLFIHGASKNLNEKWKNIGGSLKGPYLNPIMNGDQ